MTYKQLILTKGYVALVDEEDYERLAANKWTAMVTGQNIKRIYAYRRFGWNNANRKWSGMILIHREIMQAPSGVDVDHINHDALDNRRINLRLATRSQNLANNRRPRGKVGLRGVTYNNDGTLAPYCAQCAGKRLGNFFDKHDAARAYDAAAIEAFGEFAKLNFPQ